MTGRRLAAACAAVLALTACTGGDDAGTDPDASAAPTDPTASASPSGSAADALVEELLAGEEAPEAIGSARGELPLIGTETAPVEVEVLEVRAGSDSTLLRWRLRSATGQPQKVKTSALSRPSRFDTRAVTLVDRSGGMRLQPYTYIPQRNENPINCTCSELPGTVTEEGVQMYALYPPLPAGTSTVDVEIPDILAVEGVEVTR